jgi:hypothetical protein
LGELWLELVRYCDVYFDLRLHESSHRQGLLHARRDLLDIAGFQLTARCSSLSISQHP